MSTRLVRYIQVADQLPRQVESRGADEAVSMNIKGVRHVAIKGLDDLMRKMKELEKATAALDGDIASVGFDPHDPQSIELAIQQMEGAIDERVGSYRNNDLVDSLVAEMKERYREAILERAATARMEGDPES
jgi:hypothetical protein